MSSPVPHKYYDVENSPSSPSLTEYLKAAFDGAIAEAGTSGFAKVDLVTKYVGMTTVASLPVEIHKDKDRWTVNVAEVAFSVVGADIASAVLQRLALAAAAAILGPELPIVAMIAIGATVAVASAVIYNKILDAGGQEVIDWLLGSETRDIVY